MKVPYCTSCLIGSQSIQVSLIFGHQVAIICLSLFLTVALAAPQFEHLIIPYEDEPPQPSKSAPAKTKFSLDEPEVSVTPRCHNRPQTLTHFVVHRSSSGLVTATMQMAMKNICSSTSGPPCKWLRPRRTRRRPPSSPILALL